MQKFELLRRGCDILDGVMFPHGFTRAEECEQQEPSITGGGPIVARGGFVRHDRRLELEVWFELRRVVYCDGNLWLEHVPYLRALGVAAGANFYPGFSDDPLDSFRHLAKDLECFAGEFLSADAATLRRAAVAAAAQRPEQARRYRAWMVGDDSARLRARELFHRHQFAEVVRLLEGLQYPEYMDAYEKKILETARRRAASSPSSGGAPA
jgi:hypothetical protein